MALLDHKPTVGGEGNGRSTTLGISDVLDAREQFRRAGDDPHVILRTALELAAKWTGADAAWAELAHPNTEPLKLSPAGRELQNIDAIRVLVPAADVAARIRIASVCETDADPRARSGCEMLGSKSLMIAAIAVDQNDPIVLVVGAGRAGAFGAHAQSCLELLAEMLRDALRAGIAADTPDRLSAEHELRLATLHESDERFRGAFEDASVGMALATTSGRLVKVNPAFRALVGYSEVELLSRDFQSLTHADDKEITTQNLTRLVSCEIPSYHVTKRYIHKEGHDIWVRVGASRLRSSGDAQYLIAMVQDVTEEKHKEWLEQDRREILEMVAQDQPLPSAFYAVTKLVERQSAGVRACVLLLNDGAMHTFAPSFPQTMIDAVARRPVSFASGLVDGQAPPDEVQVAKIEEHPVWEGIREEAAALGLRTSWALPLRGNDGASVGLMLVCCPKDRGPTPREVAVMIAALRISIVAVEHHHTTRQLAHLVRHDPLTGMPNRIFYEDRLDQALSQARRTNAPLGLLAMDLNRFKQINDTLGHHAGDALLQQFAARLRSVIRESDTLARVGGDEFMIILPEIGSRENTQEIVNTLRQALASAPFNIGGREIQATSSIGTALYPEDGTDTATLQQAADAAMYRDKAENRRKTNAPERAA